MGERKSGREKDEEEGRKSKHLEKLRLLLRFLVFLLVLLLCGIVDPSLVFPSDFLFSSSYYIYVISPSPFDFHLLFLLLFIALLFSLLLSTSISIKPYSTSTTQFKRGAPFFLVFSSSL